MILGRRAGATIGQGDGSVCRRANQVLEEDHRWIGTQLWLDLVNLQSMMRFERVRQWILLVGSNGTSEIQATRGHGGRAGQSRLSRLRKRWLVRDQDMTSGRINDRWRQTVESGGVNLCRLIIQTWVDGAEAPWWRSALLEEFKVKAQARIWR